MGAQQSQEIISFNRLYEYQYSGADDDYGEVAVYIIFCSSLTLNIFNSETPVYRNREKHNQHFAIVKRSLTGSDDIKKRMDQINARSQLNNPYCVKIMGSHYSESKDLCGNINILYIAVEYVQKNMASDIRQRASKHFIYTEPELWYLIKSCTEGLQYYQQNNIEYQDLHPTTIRVTDEGNIKLMDLALHNEPLSNFTKVQLGLRDFEYLAPEQIQMFTHSGIRISTEKANVFCLGILCVQCILRITDPTELFKNQEISIPSERLHKYFAKNSISMKFQNFLFELLSINPSERLSFKDILNVTQLLTSNQITIQLRPTAFYIDSAEVSKVSVLQPPILPPSPSKSSQLQLHSFRNSPMSQQSPDQVKAQLQLTLRDSQQLKPTSKPIMAQQYREPEFDFTQIDMMINQALQRSNHAIQIYGRPVESQVQILPPSSTTFIQPSPRQHVTLPFQNPHPQMIPPQVRANVPPQLYLYPQAPQITDAGEQTTAKEQSQIGSRIKELLQQSEEELNKSKMLSANLHF